MVAIFYHDRDGRVLRNIRARRSIVNVFHKKTKLPLPEFMWCACVCVCVYIYGVRSEKTACVARRLLYVYVKNGIVR